MAMVNIKKSVGLVIFPAGHATPFVSYKLHFSRRSIKSKMIEIYLKIKNIVKFNEKT